MMKAHTMCEVISNAITIECGLLKILLPALSANVGPQDERLVIVPYYRAKQRVTSNNHIDGFNCKKLHKFKMKLKVSFSNKMPLSTSEMFGVYRIQHFPSDRFKT